MATKAESKPVVGVPVLIAALATLAAAGGGYYLLKAPAADPNQFGLSPEAKAYTRNLKLGNVEIKATKSYLGQEVVEIVGEITNNGDRPLKQIDLNCVFYDTMPQVVLRERVSIVRAKTGGLKPGETKAFRLPFDAIPRSWNNAMPQLVIAGIAF